jgi:hypothetical protein
MNAAVRIPLYIPAVGPAHARCLRDGQVYTFVHAEFAPNDVCLHHLVLGRGYHLAGSNNPPRMNRSTVSRIKNARRSRGSNTFPRTSSATTSAAALRAPKPLD